MSISVVVAGLAPVAAAKAFGAVSPRVAVRAALTLSPRFRVTPASESASVQFELTLATRHPRQLADLLGAVTTPGSPSFRHYLARGAFATEFGQSLASTAAVRSYLAAAGLDQIRLAPDGLTISASGSVEAAASALGTHLVHYVASSGGSFIANDRPMTIPRSLASEVTGVIGLDAPTDPTASLSRVGHSSPIVSPALPHAAAGPTISSSCEGGISADEQSVGSIEFSAGWIAAFYNFPPLYATGDLGAGKTIGLIEFSTFDRSDVDAYAACYGVTPNLRVVKVGRGSLSSNIGSEQEAELDIEDVVGLAPAAAVVVYAGTDAERDDNDTDVYADAVNDDVAQVISTSWGSCEASMTHAELRLENTIFEQAALQGETIVAASGDDGSEDCYGTLSGGRSTGLAVDDPSSQPYVTGVGGTSLLYDGQSSSGQLEFDQVVWNDGISDEGASAGGGGLSSFWPMPGYQRETPASLGVVTALSMTGTCGSPLGCREVPDLSVNAGTPYVFYCTLGHGACDPGGWTGFTGTSAAAPTVAAMVELADASPASATTGSLGFINPALYEIGAGSGYSTAFTDVTSGTNDVLSAHNGLYTAAAGYDMASGLGSPIVGSGTDTGLVTALCSPVVEAVARGESGLPAPIVTSVTPGAAAPHSKIVLRGRNLAGAESVRFGAITLAPGAFKVASNTEITALVPVGSGRTHVSVETIAGVSGDRRHNTFSFLERPLVSAIAPHVGQRSGGTTVAITGSGFTAVRSVSFGGADATRFTVISSTRIVAIAPPGSGAVRVKVTTAGGTSARATAATFSYQ